MSQSYFSLTKFKAVRLIDSRSLSGKDANLLTAEAMLAGFLGSQTRPVRPSVKKSLTPPAKVPMTGKPAAMASKKELPKPSVKDGLMKISQALRIFGKSA